MELRAARMTRSSIQSPEPPMGRRDYEIPCVLRLFCRCFRPFPSPGSPQRNRRPESIPAERTPCWGIRWHVPSVRRGPQTCRNGDGVSDRPRCSTLRYIGFPPLHACAHRWTASNRHNLAPLVWRASILARLTRCAAILPAAQTTSGSCEPNLMPFLPQSPGFYMQPEFHRDAHPSNLRRP
jgi:hypothetical protein